MKGTTHKERENSPIDCVSICSFNDLPQQNNNAAPQPKIPVFENNIQREMSKNVNPPQKINPFSIETINWTVSFKVMNLSVVPLADNGIPYFRMDALLLRYSDL